MDKKKIFKISPAVAIITLFFLISATCSAGIINNENIKNIDEYNKEKNPLNADKPAFFLYGTKGENDWYISCVTLSFIWNPDIVKEIWVFVNDAWQRYTSSIEICSDGKNSIPWYWIDIDDLQHNETPIFIRIDKTDPIVNLQKKVNSENQITFTAKVTDPASGPERVEFFVDDEYDPRVVIYEPDDFVYVWEGTAEQIITAVAYDFAGFSANDTANTKPKTRDYLFKDIFLSKPLKFLLEILIFSQNFILRLKL
jgi:hypothetical protein